MTLVCWEKVTSLNYSRQTGLFPHASPPSIQDAAEMKLEALVTSVY